MYKAFFFLAVLAFSGCKNKPDTSPASGGKKPANDSSFTSVSSQWSKEEEGEFMDNCIASAKARYNNDEKKAFSYCKCVLTQVQKRYPVADSAHKLLNDSVQMAVIMRRCK